MEPPLWSEGASPWPHEREALAFVRTRLPDFEPYRAWSNVEFIAEDGSVNEVDLLAITPRGFLLVEIKSFPGVLTGDGQRWRHRWPDGGERFLDHPLILANTKAKRLKSLLSRQRPFAKERVPFVTALVFLSSADLECNLHNVGRTGVAVRDADPGAPPPVDRGFGVLPGIIQALKDPSAAGLRAGAINKPMSKRIAEAIEQAGIKPANRGRTAGDWELRDLLDEGPGWQDFDARRPKLGATRRARVYLAGAATTADEEARLRREAEREFKLLEQLDHQHIAGARDFVQADRGPAVLFDRVEGEQRLDLWAPEHVRSLPLDARVALIRQVAEALAYAHSRRITHRLLTARSILVRPSGTAFDEPMLLVGHWQAGARELATHLTTHDTTATELGGELAERLVSDEQIYLAPETFTADDPDPVALDVFSLGSLAHLLLTGSPPAADVAARDAALADHGGLAIDAAIDGLPDELRMFVSVATDPQPANRAPVSELLSLLDDTLETLTAPDDVEEVDEDDRGTDPVAANKGDRLEGGWEVKQRLGSGSTAVALLCERPGSTEPEVLKVAKDEDFAERLRDEARALERLHHPGIVKVHAVERIGGRTTLRMEPAGDPDGVAGLTLADRLNAQGRIGLDLLERFGEDLLDAVDYLGTMGVAHRDIKPDNLGVRPRRGDRSLHLVLFDFSLTQTPDTSIGAGTRGYLDPFLAERPGKRWDPAAERYAAAVTLYEMATGTRPRWGDGRTDPLQLADEVPHVDPELFDPSVRERLVAFFERSLHRRPGHRYDTAGDMRKAWRAAFADAARGVTSADATGADPETLAHLTAAATPSTPVAELGLSGIALSVLDQRGIGTVDQLLSMSALDWNRATGVGLRVRREVLEVTGLLRSHVEVEPDASDANASIDRIAGTLVPKPTTPQAVADGPRLTYLLGLGAPDQLERDASSSPWPSAAEVRALFELDREAFDELLRRARERWAREKLLTPVRNDIGALLERSGGVLPGDEIAEALLARRGSTATGADRLARARAVVRAALETESERKQRFTWRRLGGGSVVVALRTDELVAEELADYAGSLGALADQLAASEPLPTPTAVLDRLRAVPPPAGLAALPDARLARLAGAASATAAVSSRFEIYTRGLAPERALRLARAALLGAGTLSEDEVRSRVRTRLPEAAPLPPRPELDRLLLDVLGLEWFDGGAAAGGATLPPGYRIPPPSAAVASTAFGHSGLRHRTGTVATAPDEARAAAEAADDRLARHAEHGGYLVLTVAPRLQRRAIEQLDHYDPTIVDLDRWLVDSLRATAEAKRVGWAAVDAADAGGPDGPRWTNLTLLVRDALAPLTDQLLAEHEHVLLTHPGLLGRYDQLGVLDVLRERLRRPAAEQRLRTMWVLVATTDPDAPPTVDGRAVPITTLAEHMSLPTPWLENLHRTEPVGAGEGR
ncbi:BREX system serine/threonine kinase PglW [Desertimonas flava]|uniref:BREX system serine/threonine kinase PglW n=1 Tax=Desertimonas flava TaxID=2064846 RepID=UPI000E355025|nr:BREX system serine/threonine kinase PglW [Desertimonas flava]